MRPGATVPQLTGVHIQLGHSNVGGGGGGGSSGGGVVVATVVVGVCVVVVNVVLFA